MSPYKYEQLPQPKSTPAKLPFELRPFVAKAVTQKSELNQPHLKLAPLAVAVKQEMEEESKSDKDVGKTAAQWQEEQA